MVFVTDDNHVCINGCGHRSRFRVQSMALVGISNLR